MAEKKKKEENLSRPVIVGMGASAGGLEAFKIFFQHMPPTSGMAFVLVQHLDPDHESLMVELLSRQTKMTVVQAKNNMVVQADHVYMIQPNSSLTIKNGRLQVRKPVERRGMRMPIDYFLRSLAEDQKERAICIIFSGTGTDGTLGVKAVKEVGGLVMVQEPSEAAYDGMPLSAAATNMVDFILPIEKMAVAIARYIKHDYFVGDADATPKVRKETDQFNKILSVLKARGYYDFRAYKKNTLIRRIQRRMGLNSSSTFEEYLELIRNSPEELKLLSRDMLITVTNFFRDKEAMDVLKDEVISKLVEKFDGDHPIRVWVAGTATGEEAYSIAIMFLEAFEEAQKQPKIQIFASDVEEETLDFARAGRYPESIAADVTAERLKRYFIKEGITYKVNKTLRESVVFASQNLVSDAPFSRLDLISCRNLLIYIDPVIQKKIIPLFHFALRPNGYLFLGSSETIGRELGLFETVSKPMRIYRRIGASSRGKIDFPLIYSDESVRLRPYKMSERINEAVPAEIARKALLDNFAPDSVLIGRNYEVHYFFGKTGVYLDQPTGQPVTDLMLLCKHGLRTKLRGAIHKAIEKEEQVTVCASRVKRDGDYVMVNITVTPVNFAEDGLLLVSFRDEEKTNLKSWERLHEEMSGNGMIQQLEYELHATREDLQSTIEEMETSNEELKASNEEVMSMNEELQSTNEELETSKEELQSLNEELTTVNNQLQDKVMELEEINNDLDNLLTSTDIATLFLDSNMKIKRFTSSGKQILNLIETDIGRPLKDISHSLDDTDMIKDSKQVLAKLMVREKETADESGNWFLRRIVPYRTHDNKIEGVVITFTDITTMKQAELSLRESEKLLAEAQHIGHMGSWALDIEENKLTWSDEIYRIFDISKSDFNHSYEGFINCVHPDDRKAVSAAYKRSLEKRSVYDIRHRILKKDGSVAYVHELCETLYDEDGRAVRSVGTVQDVTAQELNIQKQRIFIEQAPISIAMFDHNMRYVAVSKRWLEDYGLKGKELIGLSHYEVFPETPETWKKAHQSGLKGEVLQSRGDEFIRADGSIQWISWAIQPWYKADHQVGGIIMLTEDVTEKKKKEEIMVLNLQELERRVEERTAELRDAKEAAEAANVAKSRFLSRMSHELRTPLNAILGFSSLLVEDERIEKGDLQETLGYITKAGDHLLALIEEILDLSSIEAGRLKLKIQPVDFSSVVDECVSQIKMAIAQKKDVTITIVQTAPDLPINVDELRFRQILFNLLSNAVKYNYVGGSVTVKMIPVGEDRIRILVTDTGVGISKKDKEKLFKPFEHLNLKGVELEGAGIGLTVTKQLVEAMDGLIGVQSVEEQGSTFWVEFPVASCDVDAGKKEMPEEDKTVGNIQPQGEYTILYIEDNPANIRLMVHAINTNPNYNLLTSISAEEGLKIAEKVVPDIILMDIELPGMNGDEALKELRKKEATREVPVIAVTANAMPEDVQAGLEMGFTKYLTKPFRLPELFNLLKEVAASTPKNKHSGSA